MTLFLGSVVPNRRDPLRVPSEKKGWKAEDERERGLECELIISNTENPLRVLFE
jgi:hypothetical protein